MTTSTQNQLRAALNEVTAAMNAAIALAKDLGRFEERDVLIMQRDGWVRAANRLCNSRGRTAVPPIVPASYTLKPMVRTRPAVQRPHLRVVELEPFSVTIDRVVAEAERTQRASRQLLQDAQESLDAG
jgi:hypothetical protein